MKFTLVFLLFLVNDFRLFNVLGLNDEDILEHLYIEQKLDNFDENNTATWQMYYMSRKEFYKPGGPLFIIIGAEWVIVEASIRNEHFKDLAKEHNAHLFFIQHRYYGKSQPTENLSTENLKYLNAQQGLADIAHFARTMQATIPDNNSKIIWLGASFAAAMTTWFGKLYPELVTGAWAPSGPLLAKTNFLEHKEEIGKEIRIVGGQQCYDRIENSFQQVQSMVTGKRVAEVKAVFKICDNFNPNNKMDLYKFFHILTQQFPDQLLFAKKGDIESICSFFNGVVEDYVALASYTFSRHNMETCIDVTYKSYLNKLMNITDTVSIDRPWYYQKCNEFGWFETTDSKNQPFGNVLPLDYFITICRDLFGNQYTSSYVDAQVKKTNEIFGGLNPGVKNYYFTQGGLDPLKVVGISNFTIPWASHNNDIFDLSEDDDVYLRASRKILGDLVKKWLNSD